MMTLSQEQANTAWVQFYTVFERLGLSKHYDMDKLKTELLSSPCAITEDMGTAYKGALLMHINMVMALAQRMTKMISGTFQIDEGKDPQVPNTARQVACLPGNTSRGKRSSMPQPKTRPDSPVPSLQGPCDRSLKSEEP